MDKYEMLNDKQREAVFYTEGPLLILAGAGSGKTKVLTHRIAYLIEEKGVAPYEIMAITFTNKAAEEMKRRVENLVDYGDSVWVMTFHSTCVRILRRFIDRLGYDTDFTIYDADDQKTAVRHVIKELNFDPKQYKERALVSYISACKTQLITPEDAMKSANEFAEKRYAMIYDGYERRLKANNALDFDDLLLKTVELFRSCPEVLRHYQNRFRYIMVDEYQDTNSVQFQFIHLLSMEHKNLAVVGDDDQSIYKFRGADIRNILDFEQAFPGTKVVKLEQNYRSTSHILDVANAVIKNNKYRKDKHLWSNLGAGSNVTFRMYDAAPQEAEGIVRKIQREVHLGNGDYRDYAVLYRTNAQSRLFEEKCIELNVPYILVGGVNFYQREEVKDVLAYLKTIASGRDDLSTERIINKPRRGIGATSLQKVEEFAKENGLSLMEAATRAGEIPNLGAAKDKFLAFAHLIGTLRDDAGIVGDPLDRMGFGELIQEIVDRVEYEKVLEEYEDDKREQKEENIRELVSKAQSFEEDWEGENPPTLIDFLEEVALVADIDSMSDDDNKVVLMTLHGSKGLEFPHVFLTGLEEGLFPSYMSITSEDHTAVEEERRLAYVGMTRAMEDLYLTAAKSRMVNGSTQYNEVSRFVKEIPTGLCDGLEALKQRSYEDESPRSTFKFGGSFGASNYGGGYGGGSYGGGSYGGYGNSGASSYGRGYGDAKQGFGEPVSGFSGSKGGAKPGVSGLQKGFGLTKGAEIGKPAALDYGVGDRVRHIKFGTGTVKEIVEETKDYAVTVLFDSGDEKRMLAGFAKLKKI